MIDGVDVPFGIDKIELIETLEELAKAIDEGVAIPQQALSIVEQSVCEFELITLSVTYAKQRTPQS